jgi:hypothetical protein
MKHQLMTEDEKVAITMKAIGLLHAGDEEGAHALLSTLPLSPCLAKVFKEKLGADFLINDSYNLSEAEAKFGPNWLNT